MATVIDAHVHLWDPARGDYGWLAHAPASLNRPFDEHELHAVLKSVGVNGVVLVQAAPTEAESDYLLSTAERARWVFGVVGWIDFDADGVERTIERRALQPKFVGVRPMLQDIADADWIVHPRRARALEALAAHGLTFDALIRPIHLSRIAHIARAHSNLSIVIDHAAKPTIGNQINPAWREGLNILAACPNVSCKLSGLLTELSSGVEPRKVLDYARVVLQTFGAGRVLWGSDWPVLTQAASYHDWFALAREILEPLSNADRQAVMGGNAERIYKLKPPASNAAILLHPDDNVLVCCRPVVAGEQLPVGAGEQIEVTQDVDLGHKLARRSLSAGEKVIKYGAPIGSMKSAVTAGGWIHLHNMKSDYISAHTRAAKVSET